MKIFRGVFVASAIPALVVGAAGFVLERNNRWFLLGAAVAFIVSLAHVVFAGVPAVLVLNRIGRLNWCSVMTCGFVVGAASQLALSYALVPSGGGYSSEEWVHGHMEVLVGSGALTEAGWSQLAFEALSVGFIGALVSAIFYAAARAET